MDIFNGLESITKTSEPLGPYTWYAIGGPAEYFLTPQTTDQLSEVIRRCHENGLDIHILGFGSNLLVDDAGVQGAVIKLDGEQFTNTEFHEKEGHLTAWAGANLSKLVLDCVRRGLSGLEPLTGIPGSVGGAVRMNAGGNFGDIGAVIESVTLMDNEGNVYEKIKPELVFDYRTTNITARCILNAKIELVPDNPDHMLKTIKEIWIYKKNSQPLSARNAGCVFKNPRGMSAGALIDRSGLKGLAIGGAQVSEKHANFIVTQNGCTAADVKRLIEAVRERVREKFDIELELEIEIW